MRGVIDHLHPETEGGAPGDGLADPAHADHAQGLAAEVQAQHLRGVPPLPPAGADQPFALGRAAGGHQDQRQGDIGGGIGDRAGGVGDRNAVVAGGGGVDMVVTHPEIGQQPAGRAGYGLKDRALEAVAQGGQDDVVVAQGRDHLGLVQRAGAGADGGVECGPGGGQDGFGQGTGDQKFHQHSLAPFGIPRSGPARTTAPSAS